MKNIIKGKDNKLIKAAVFGSLAGAVMGLFLAPKKGQELRKDIVDQAQKVEGKVIEIKGMAQSAWQNVEDKTQVTVNTGKNWIQKGKKLVSNLKTLVSEIRNGALTKTCSVDSSMNTIEIKDNDHVAIEDAEEFE